MDSDSESKLISLISQVITHYWESKLPSLIIQTIYLVRSMDLDSQPKPQSKLMSLIEQTISLLNSMDLDSQPKPLSNLISLISQLINGRDSDLEAKREMELVSLSHQTLSLEPEPELMVFIRQIVFLATSISSKWKKLISLCPQVEVVFEREKHVIKKIPLRRSNKWKCLPINWRKISITGEDATHFMCEGCNGANHKEFEKAPLEVKHPLHPKDSLQLVSFNEDSDTMECYCCDKYLEVVFYYCSACDFALNIACVEEPPVLSIDHSKWHKHTLSLFARTTSLTCNICALAYSACGFYICPPCGFVVHRRCLKLPHVIRISRHPHRISFTHSFDQGNWSCGVCRQKVDNDYGGYSCIRDCCLYAAHSRCATQINVWDGIDLDGVPEEIEEEAEPPFVRISDRIIQHFSHQHHHLRLDEDMGRVFNENKLCQICITPIYFGNFYSCMKCEFILHETCANSSRKLYHPIHRHRLTLALARENNSAMQGEYTCTACGRAGTAGFIYECNKDFGDGLTCEFKLHVQCATISEPLVHGSHIHPLFLTTKPGEYRDCSFCHTNYGRETFNCIKCDCEFSLCYGCATIPEEVRYKHDKHTLTLSYGEEISTMMNWCEACEGKIDPKERYYMCNEYCCVTLHIECLIGKDLYMKPGSSWIVQNGTKVNVMPNNHYMSRPICKICEKRCAHKIVFEHSGLIFCCKKCLLSSFLKIPVALWRLLLL